MSSSHFELRTGDRRVFRVLSQIYHFVVFPYFVSFKLEAEKVVLRLIFLFIVEPYQPFVFYISFVILFGQLTTFEFLFFWQLVENLVVATIAESFGCKSVIAYFHIVALVAGLSADETDA